MSAKEEVNAKKQVMGIGEAKTLLGRATKLVSARGKKVVSVDLRKETLTDDEIAKLMLGPTGNLRAPTLVVGKTLLIGFDQATYQEVLQG
ncbi:MAG: hypothetical protein KDB22_14560 [Planctomycetales bacterium]|nr:hypothetical protein [Planctomycetales bacterium]